MNVFIDLGSHFGAIIRKFMASKLYSPDFIIHAFEPNPVIFESVFMNYPPNVTIHRQAAWIYDGEIDFFLNPDQRYQGASVCKEKQTGWLDKEHPVMVRCIDFSAWMRENLSKDDNIIMKCNIEGAEYPLFEKLMADGTIEYIKRLYLRRHWHKIGMPQEMDSEFMGRLSAFKNMTIVNDYSF